MPQSMNKALDLKRQLADAMPGSTELIREGNRCDELIWDHLPPH